MQLFRLVKNTARLRFRYVKRTFSFNYMHVSRHAPFDKLSLFVSALISDNILRHTSTLTPLKIDWRRQMVILWEEIITAYILNGLNVTPLKDLISCLPWSFDFVCNLTKADSCIIDGHWLHNPKNEVNRHIMQLTCKRIYMHLIEAPCIPP